MANEKNAANAAQTVENTVFKAIITKVMEPQGSDNRISLVTNTNFKVIDFTDGTEKDTNIIGINIYNLVNQLNKVGGAEYIQLADALCMGKAINPQIISLSLLNAEIKVKRLFHTAGEAREIEGVYEKDCYTTEIVGVTTHINELTKSFLIDLIKTQPYKKVEVAQEAKPASFTI